MAVATHKGIAIWHLGLNPDIDGRLSVERVALLSGHDGEVMVPMYSYSSFYFVLLYSSRDIFRAANLMEMD